ncbi:MAG: hypothetical protein PWQ79_127 [Thermococcaceae archaeon]|nr:hypothetical protein [Thermococcaceae archaeon]MDK2913212.1 hypothetical protein [Thermococcaceae archaeon]
MGDPTEALAPFAPYVIATAIIIFGVYAFIIRKKFANPVVIAMSGITAALVAVATSVIKITIPTTGGYLNFGDTMVMFTAMTFGPVIGAFAGGVGSALGDVIVGAPGWAPVTLVVKGLEGLAIGYLAKRLKGTGGLIVAGAVGGLIMVAGYFFFELYAFGFSIAYSEIPVNLLQAVTGIIVGTGLTTAIKRRYPELEDLV